MRKFGKQQLLLACFTLTTALWGSISMADNWSAHREYREGMQEISREKDKMRRDILNADNKWEAERAYRKGMRNIEKERREMRREVGKELRDYDHRGRPDYRPGKGRGRK